MQNLFINHPDIPGLLADFKFLAGPLTLLFALITTLVIMPKIIAISKKKNLTVEENGRTSHTGIVPTLGGIGVFIGILLTNNVAAFFYADYSQLIDLVVFDVLILLFLLVGISDDLMDIRARKKFLYQIIISTVFVFGTSIHITSFAGLFGLHELNDIFSIIFSIFVIVLVINAYNLIDGIDGLAGSLGVIIAGFMALIFYLGGYFFYMLMSLSLLGSLLAFLAYNFSHKRKIFLGDTGSMVVGFVLAYLMLLYLSLSTHNAEPIFKNAPLFVLALLSYPLIDTLRVFIVRMKNGYSPFRADRNHIHHRLVDLGLRHKYATLIIGFYTVVITVLAYMLHDLSINIAFVILLLVAFGFLSIPFIIERRKNKSNELNEIRD